MEERPPSLWGMVILIVLSWCLVASGAIGVYTLVRWALS